MSLADKIETWAYGGADDLDFIGLLSEARRIETERDAFYQIISLQQTVDALEKRIDGICPEQDLEERVRSVLAYLRDLTDFKPAEGFDAGWVSGIEKAIEKIEQVL